MTTALSTKPAALTLPALADEIRVECKALEADFESGLRKGVTRAVSIGGMLNAAKAQCAHGEWIPWLEQEFPYTRKTAAEWMRLAEANVTGRLHLNDTVESARKRLAPPKPAKIEAESEPDEDGESENGDAPAMGEVVAEVLYDPKKGGVVEEDSEIADDDGYPRPADPGEIGFVADQMRMLVIELELYTGMESMAKTMAGWIQELEREICNNE